MTNRPIRLAGYAALFDIPDSDRDTIRRGAFAQTLAARKLALPLLWQHRPDQPLGVVESVKEDTRGLKVIALIDQINSRGARQLASKAVNGLSFGYRVREARQSQSGRELLGIDLFEVSLVTDPLHCLLYTSDAADE